jgi:hypothetical protein
MSDGIRYPRGAVGRSFAPKRDWGTGDPRQGDPNPDGQTLRRDHDQWLWRIRKLAGERGWECACWWDSRHSPPGFPDIFAVNVEQQRTIHIEAKTGKGRLTKNQRKWRDRLLAVGAEWYEMRPEEELLLLKILEGKQPPRGR